MQARSPGDLTNVRNVNVSDENVISDAIIVIGSVLWYTVVCV